MIVAAPQPQTRAGGQMDFLLCLFRPLLKVDEAAYLLGDPSPQTITRRLEDGTLRGVDISEAGAEAGRRELRVYRYSVEHQYCPATRGRRVELIPVEMIFPHGRDVFRRDEVAQILNCTAKHVGNLAFDGPQLSRAASKASADRCPRVTRAALTEFLNAREVRL
jgi:hypothetical protein